MLRSLAASAVMVTALAGFTLSPHAASTPAAEAATVSPDCCTTYDANVDCWCDGHWHYNHCEEACTVERK